MSAAVSRIVPAVGIGHFVQFYESDEVLIRHLASFVLPYLRGNDASLVIATPSHAEQLIERLRAEGVDVPSLHAAGTFVVLDADDLLRQLIVGNELDAERFGEVMIPVLERLVQGKRRIRAYVELDAILRMDGRKDAALRLETLWSDLRLRYPLSLYCAYPVKGFTEGGIPNALDRKCEPPIEDLPANHHESDPVALNKERPARAPERLGNAAAMTNQAQPRDAEFGRACREPDLAEFLESSMECMRRVNRRGMIEWANKAELEFMGFVAHDYVGHQFEKFCVDPGTARDLLARLQRGEVVRNYPLQLRTKDGSCKFALTHSSPYMENNTFTYARCVTRDVTEVVHLVQERDALLEKERIARAKAEQSNRLKDEFLNILSHELRTPVSAVLAWTQLLRRSGSSSEADLAMGLEIIERNTRLQGQMVNDLLDLSRLAAGTFRLNQQRVNLNDIVDQAAESTHRIAKEKNLGFEILLDPESPVILGDSLRLQQAISNLMHNAVKFTPDGGHVRVSILTEANIARICVADTGRGIHPDFLPEIFDRFRQEDSSITRPYGGLGIGLHLVRQLVELHGGRAFARSEGIGCGSTFVIELPISSDED